MNDPRFPATEPHRRAHAMAIAGLLHDIGKILDAGKVDLPVEFRERMERLVCPIGRHGYTHRHALYSAWALDQLRLQTAGFSIDEILRLAANHHNPDGDSFDQHLMQKADWLASGHDRDASEGAAASETTTVTGLAPPLAALKWPADDRSPEGVYRTLPTLPLGFSADEYLPRDKGDEASYRAACRRIWQTMQQELVDFASDDATDAVDRLLGCLERYCHAVPASRSRQHEPDVNLFDHSRLVAAFAACLAIEHGQGPCDARKIHGRYRLLQLGLGGIQAFITRSVTPMDAGAGESGEKGMAKRLRARSFYVTLLTWLAGRRILQACGLPPVNLVQDAGGRAMLLLPGGEPTLQRVREALGAVRHWFHRRLGNAVRFDAALTAELHDDDFLQRGFARTLRALDDQLAAARYANPWPHLCVDGQWLEDGWVADRESQPIDRDAFLRSLEEFGRRLPRRQRLTIDDANGRVELAAGELEILGYRLSLDGAEPQGARRSVALELGTSHRLLPRLLAPSRLPLRAAADEAVPARAAGEPEPRDTFDDAQPLTFSELACLSVDDDGREVRHPMLAALKADVDHLGMLFGHGLQERASFGRYAGAARYLDTFFKGFLVEQLRTSFPHVYAVFAGGDDLFLIGPWYDMVRFVPQLRRWFEQAAAGNSCIHLSAGLAFAKPKTPVSRLADYAETAVRRAKHEGRNRLAFGELTLAWEEFDKAFDLHRAMLVASVARDLSNSLAYRLLQYARQATGLQRPEGEAGLRPADRKWRAQMSYDLARNLAEPGRSAAVDRLRELLHAILETRDAKRLYVAASLTLYHVRGHSP